VETAAANDHARSVAIRTRLEGHPTLVAALLTLLAVAALVAHELYRNGGDVGTWDVLFLSGCLTAIAGLWLARGHTDNFGAMLVRLADRRALWKGKRCLGRDELAEVAAHVNERAWSRGGGWAVAVLVAGIWVTVNLTRGQARPLLEAIGGPAVGALGGLLVGRVVGRMLAQSLLGRALGRARIVCCARPGHVDGAAGLKPVGDYFVEQALLLVIPALFLLVWSLILLTPSWDARYPGWHESYLGLLAVAICLEIVAFIVPLWSVHTVMKQQKRDALVHADRDLGRGIAKLQLRLEGNVEDRAVLEARLERMTARYAELEAMPTWPIDPTLRRRLTLGNLGLVFGLVIQAVSIAGYS
jgi:hypothetical protein